MVIKRLHHVLLAAPAGCEADARAFFTGILGLTEIPKPANLLPRGGVWFRGDGFELHIGVDADFRPAVKAHTAFEVDDLEALRRVLEAHDIRAWEDEPLPGYYRFYANDPFGNRLEFLQPSPTDKD